MIAYRIPLSPGLSRTLVASTLLALFLTAATGAFAGVVAGKGGVEFTCKAPTATAVYLAGDFNSWNATAQALANGGGGAWSVTVALPAGDHEYKFVVDGVWMEDADNPRRKADPFGGSNSLVTVDETGKPATAAAAAPALQAASPTAGDSGAKPSVKFTVGAPRAVEGGIQFTYHNPGAAKVTLAGTFNGWNADQLPLTGDGKGNWVIVHKLPAGKHEYKFVADGSWFADSENPETAPDPYGGTNSLVTVGADGKLVAGGAVTAGTRPASNTSLSPKVYIGGRYLTRYAYAKELDPSLLQRGNDTRFRLKSPYQTADLNFETKVSDLTDMYVRLRVDSDVTFIKNNIDAFLDEASLTTHPSNFTLKAFLNQEAYTGGDLMRMGGDLDDPGTIMPDHLNYGKGTAGAHMVADPIGLHLDAFFANVHNQDLTNDPDFFDNTGEDRVGVRLSHKSGNLEVGVPMWAERWLQWFDFSALVTLPSSGIPALDEHRAETGDPSTWYEVESHTYNVGLDARYHAGPQWTLGAEGIAVDRMQRFVTGSDYGQNLANGAMDVPFLDRTQVRFQIEADWTPREGLSGRLRHLWDSTSGGSGTEREMALTFLPTAVANGRVVSVIMPSPAVATMDSTELTLDWKRDNQTVSLWARRSSIEMDYAAVGRTAPEDAAKGSHRRDNTYFAGRGTTGLPADKYGHFELEWGVARLDQGVAGIQDRTIESILRWDRDLTRNTGLIADLRWISYHHEQDGEADLDRDFFAPFFGVRYRPVRNVDVVAAWGVDPVDFAIDYNGRQNGRWWYRQRWMFEKQLNTINYGDPAPTILDAEDHLAKARVITLRAQLQF